MKALVLFLVLVFVPACGIVTMPKGGVFANSDNVASESLDMETPAPIAKAKLEELVQHKLEPGVRLFGKMVVSVGCVEGISNIALAFDTAEGRARVAAVGATCADTKARVTGGHVIRRADDGGRVCVEMATPMRSIDCINAI